jgi:hypothetical protein
MIGQDDLGAVALRLGRAFNQAWAVGAPKGVPWNWRLAAYYARNSGTSRKPVVDDTNVEFRHQPRGMRWCLNQRAVRVEFADKRDCGGSLVATVSELFQPAILLRLDNWAGMSPDQVRRFDQAMGAVSTGPWKAFYPMPPLSVLGEVVGDLPDYPVTLAYMFVGSDPTLFAVCDFSGEKKTECSQLGERVRALVDDGLLKRWHRLRVRA